MATAAARRRPAPAPGGERAPGVIPKAAAGGGHRGRRSAAAHGPYPGVDDPPAAVPTPAIGGHADSNALQRQVHAPADACRGRRSRAPAAPPQRDEIEAARESSDAAEHHAGRGSGPGDCEAGQGRVRGPAEAIHHRALGSARHQAGRRDRQRAAKEPGRSTPVPAPIRASAPHAGGPPAAPGARAWARAPGCRKPLVHRHPAIFAWTSALKGEGPARRQAGPASQSPVPDPPPPPVAGTGSPVGPPFATGSPDWLPPDPQGPMASSLAR